MGAIIFKTRLSWEGLKYWALHFSVDDSESALIYGGNEKFKINQTKVLPWGKTEEVLRVVSE